MNVTGSSECWKSLCYSVHLLTASGGFYSK